MIRTASCVCGAKLTLTTPREHTWVEEHSQDVEPTCTEAGKINGRRCMICGTFVQDDAEALGHDWEEIEKEKADCTSCGHALGHEYYTIGQNYKVSKYVIKDHKFVEIKTMSEEEAPEWTLDEYNAWVEKAKTDGQEIKEYTLGCPER